MNELVIIAGMPRSGTTWVGKIFDSHPNTAYRAEPDNGAQLDGVPMFPPREMPSSELIMVFAKGLPGLRRYGIAGKPPSFNKSYRNDFSNLLFTTAASVARIGSQFNLDIPVAGARVNKAKPQPVMVWKTIRSLGRCELLLRTLTHAKFVHLLRHPCGHIASVLRGANEGKFPSDTDKYYRVFQQLLNTSNGKNYSITLDELKALKPEERLAWRWMLVNEKALLEAKAYGLRTRAIRYEDICSNPIGEIQKLFHFTGLDWATQTEDFLNRSTETQIDRYFTVFKNPDKAANRWREELDSKVIDRIMAIIAKSELLSQFYPREMA